MVRKDRPADAGNPDEWEPAELKVKRPPTAVVSVRMPAELLIAAESYAKVRSMSISDVIRVATERLLRGAAHVPTYAVVATAPTGLKLAGPTVLVHAFTLGTRPVWQQGPPPSPGANTLTGVTAW